MLGYIFTFLYTFLIISTVQSIFMVVVEDAYVTAKYSTKLSWLVEIENNVVKEEVFDKFVTKHTAFVSKVKQDIQLMFKSARKFQAV
jgi:hypothetical protein